MPFNYHQSNKTHTAEDDVEILLHNMEQYSMEPFAAIGEHIDEGKLSAEQKQKLYVEAIMNLDMLKTTFIELNYQHVIRGEEE